MSRQILLFVIASLQTSVVLAELHPFKIESIHTQAPHIQVALRPIVQDLACAHQQPYRAHFEMSDEAIVSGLHIALQLQKKILIDPVELDCSSPNQLLTLHVAFNSLPSVSTVYVPDHHPIAPLSQSGSGSTGNTNTDNGTDTTDPNQGSGGDAGQDSTGGTDSSNNGSTTPSIWDGFELVNSAETWITWRADALPNVQFNPANTQNAYRVELTDNANNKTLHFHGSQGRLDGIQASFPFEIVVRNIGIRDYTDNTLAPAPNPNAYIFSGVQIHTLNENEANSVHVVVGHRGPNPSTIEGKTTVNASSTVSDLGHDVLQSAR